ncbi:hypothetical protein JTE90_018076 [Oedothorax gibbosus]|uniref:IRF tryptophan pentad repeat domain-containing protein n=1 Tax=Oedothorax gibbosus TaxID=931172 RepID=A0AAV6UCM8_9ARAC|nr:hypothetical protein JTE90_018076 [Oedothorax gibbosus]
MADVNPRVRLLQDFLIPHLDRGTFHDKLCWVDRNRGVFKIFWRHQSSSRFSAQDSIVFQEWAVAKGLWDPHNPRGPTIYKQRMRAALLKLKNVRCISKDSEARIYRIMLNSTYEALEDKFTTFFQNSSYYETFFTGDNEEWNYELLQSDTFIEQIINMDFSSTSLLGL